MLKRGLRQQSLFESSLDVELHDLGCYERLDLGDVQLLSLPTVG